MRPKKYIFPSQLKVLAIIFTFLMPNRPIETFTNLGAIDSSKLGQITSYVYDVLSCHFSLPVCLNQITYCLRPDIINVALKVWKHGVNVEETEHIVNAVSKERWCFDAYCLVGQKTIETLLWLGAALMCTGRKRDADITIGQTFLIVCEKDKIAATLLMMICAQYDETVERLIRNGPRVFMPLATAPKVF